ncbi:MAG: hypothetical protein P4L90_01895 [Rhodopila sp.]|nr:hypothetical protein [Rhodopila sp.]
MNNPTEKDRLAILKLEDALVDDLLAMSDNELTADSREIGMDVEQEAMHVRQLLERTAGKARMAAAKAELAEYHARGALHARGAGARPSNDLREARLTLAARNGTDQTEADIKSVAEDLAELAAFEDKSKK